MDTNILYNSPLSYGRYDLVRNVLVCILITFFKGDSIRLPFFCSLQLVQDWRCPLCFRNSWGFLAPALAHLSDCCSSAGQKACDFHFLYDHNKLLRLHCYGMPVVWAQVWWLYCTLVNFGSFSFWSSKECNEIMIFLKDEWFNMHKVFFFQHLTWLK